LRFLPKTRNPIRIQNPDGHEDKYAWKLSGFGREPRFLFDVERTEYE
jgi:hypothetical protein